MNTEWKRFYTHCSNGHTLLAKKVVTPPSKDNKTNMDRTFVFPLGWNWHDMDPWLFPNEIRHYLGQTFNARSSGIVELRNHSIGGPSPKSIFTLWQLWINICIFFQKYFWLFEQCPVQPLWVLGMRCTCPCFAKCPYRAHRCYCCPCGFDSCYRQPHTQKACCHWIFGARQVFRGSPKDNTSARLCIAEDGPTGSFLECSALTARMRNLYGMRAGRTTVNNRLLSRGYRAYRPTTKPLLTANHRRLRLEWAQRWRNLTVAQWQHVIFSDESRFQLYPVDGRLRVRRLPGERVRSTYGELSTIAPNPLLCSLTDILTGVLYRGILENTLVPFARHYFGDNYRYQDDNATPHRARVVLDFLQQGNACKIARL